MTDQNIIKLRGAIDEVDDKIIALLNERSSIVKQVGMTKKQRQQDGTAFIRSGREASMLRRIYAVFKEHSFSPAAAAQIWRTIISASLAMESPLTVTAYATDTNSEMYWLAREYFGNFTPIARQPSAKRVLGDILDGKAEVGVLPIPDESFAENAQEGAWWSQLPENIKIFACVPFILAKGAKASALAVAKVQPENTGDDISLLSFKTDMDVSQSRLKGFFDKQNLTVRWLAIDASSAKHRLHLVEIKGFVTEGDKTLQALKTEIGESLLSLSLLGAYANPIVA